MLGLRCSKLLYALLDEGSTSTLIDKKVANELGINITLAEVALRGVGSDNVIALSNEKTDLKVKCLSNIYTLKNVLIVPKLALPQLNLSRDITNKCVIETGIYVNPYEATPTILIGQDNYNLIITRDFREMKSDTLVVSRSLLGWAIHGYTQGMNSGTVNSIYSGSNEKNFVNNGNDCELNELVKLYFDIDALGVSTVPRVNSDDSLAIEILDKTSKFVNGRWEVGLLWKSNKECFHNGRPNALYRLQLLEKKLDRNPDYAKLYYGEMKRLIDNGYAEKTDQNTTGKRYLPHFGVVNVNKPGRVRLVFDAASKSCGSSFNDFLLSGPDLLKSLPGVIMRFRQFFYAVKADIKDMFLKIKIRSEDCDAQRFLWRADDRSSEPSEYVMKSMLFGAKSSPCSALYIKNRNAEEFSTIYPSAVNSIINNCYMDDYLDSCDNAQEANHRAKQIIEINARANWEMHGWASNDATVLTGIDVNNNTNHFVKINNNEKCTEKVLGLQWLNDIDYLSFKINKNKITPELLEGRRIPTKREFLRVIMSIFDPLGFLTPLTIQSKILMQNVWSSKIDWDERLKECEFEQWESWLKNLEMGYLCKIPRCYQLKDCQIKTAELHVFCDASSRAYAAVAYWRFPQNNGSFHTAFIVAKSRVAPLKPISIPRLELQAAVLATRVAKTVENEHNFIITRRVFWSDSKVVLHWIQKDPRSFKMFVMNRLGEISKNTQINEWKWVPTKENPADDGTRITPNALIENSRWFLGPPFLSQEEFYWPIQNFSHKIDDDISEYSEKNILVASTITEIKGVIDVTRFSTFNRLINTVTYVLKAIDHWKKRSCTAVERRKRAQRVCFKLSQYNSFSEEIKSLEKSKSIPRNSRISCLSSILDDEGLLRAEGRLTNLAIPNFSLCPVILDGKDLTTRLLIQKYHEMFYHGSHETVLNELRQKFWIVGSRQSLRSIVSKCSVCKLQRGLPANPKMAPVPPERLGYRLHPFTNCGIDYFGPITVKVGRRREKRWGVIFTCLTTRAIHIEIAHTLSTDSAIMALQRFSSRRGIPSIIYSDNGTNLRGADKELRFFLDHLNNDKINNYAVRNFIEWKFNPPTASHMGGAWERLIQSIKKSLKVALKNHAPKDEVLATILTEIEHSLNSRPLTHVSIDPRDQEALTPNHFLLGASSGNARMQRFDAQKNCTQKDWCTIQHFANMFWRRWLREYLPSLLPRKKWHEDDIPLKVGDIVLILDNNTARNEWRKGVITRVFPGADKQVRTVEVKTANGILLRPSRKLIKFSEVQSS